MISLSISLAYLSGIGKYGFLGKVNLLKTNYLLYITNDLINSLPFKDKGKYKVTKDEISSKYFLEFYFKSKGYLLYFFRVIDKDKISEKEHKKRAFPDYLLLYSPKDDNNPRNFILIHRTAENGILVELNKLENLSSTLKN